MFSFFFTVYLTKLRGKVEGVGEGPGVKEVSGVDGGRERGNKRNGRARMPGASRSRNCFLIAMT